MDGQDGRDFRARSVGVLVGEGELLVESIWPRVATPGDHKGSPLRGRCAVDVLVGEEVWLVESIWPRFPARMPLRSRFACSRPLSPRKGTVALVLARVRDGVTRGSGFVAREGVVVRAIRGISLRLGWVG